MNYNYSIHSVMSAFQQNNGAKITKKTLCIQELLWILMRFFRISDV